MARLNVWLSLLLSGAALRACVAFQPSAQHRSRVAMRMSERDTSSTPAAIDRRQALAPLLLVPGLLLAADGASAKSLLEKRQGGYYQMVDEPTETFKASEKKATDFKRKQIEYRKKFDESFAKVSDAVDDPARQAGLKEVTKLVRLNKGLPEGLPLNSLITLVRRTKGAAKKKGEWGTDTELAYMGLIREIKEERRTDLASADE